MYGTEYNQGKICCHLHFLYDVERSSEAIVCDPDQDLSKEGVLA